MVVCEEMVICKYLEKIPWEAISAISTFIATVAIIIAGFIAVRQLILMKRFNIAQAFSTIISILQDEKVRKSRKILMDIEETDFSKWSSEQVEAADLVCSTYDVVGIMLKNEVVDHRLVTKEWHNSIRQCWEKANPMVNEYRRTRGLDFWDDFEWLYKKVKS